MDGWLGDAVLESFPAFIVTEEAKEALLELGVTGASFDEVEVTTGGAFRDLYSNRKLPRFAWLKPKGAPGWADFGTASDGRLAVSKRALDVLRQFRAANALVEPFEA